MASRKIHAIKRISRLFQPQDVTPPVSEISSAAPKSYNNMIKYGFITSVNKGMYAFLPLGLRVLNKLTNFVDTEMAKIDAQKILLPALTSSKLWKMTNRYESCNMELFKVKDRYKKEYILSPTYEEVICNLLSNTATLSSKTLPLRLYQISSKWRDEKKSRIGLLRSKEFIMKDLYTFDINLDEAQNTYNLVCETYDNIFKEIGIEFVKVLGDTGIIGGSMSHEYHYLCNVGEDTIVTCSSCNYYVNKNVNDQSHCPHCQKILRQDTAVEVGHTFLLDTKYSKPFNAVYKKNNVPTPLAMGCFGLGLSRIITAAVEILSTDEELRWPKQFAPYTVCIIPPKGGSKEESATVFVDEIYKILCDLNIDSILDDRIDLTIGKRLKYVCATGYPYIIVIGKTAMQPNPLFELHDLNDKKHYHLSLEGLNDYFKNMNVKETERIMKSII